MTGGAVSLCFAFLSLTFQHLFSSQTHLYFYSDAIGMSFSIAGIFLMVLGLRSHYLVWSRKVINKAPHPVLLRERRDLEE